MKKYFLVLIFSFIHLNCSDDNTLSSIEENNFRETAYASLSEQEKATIINDWNDAPVTIGKYGKSDGLNFFLSDNDIRWSFIIFDSSMVLLENQTLFAVSFNTKDDSLLGPITVIINPWTNKAIGSCLRL
jgi:hypothetical protein